MQSAPLPGRARRDAHGLAAAFEQPRFTMLDTFSASELAHRLRYAWPR
jgi:hypothetical protein